MIADVGTIAVVGLLAVVCGSLVLVVLWVNSILLVGRISNGVVVRAVVLKGRVTASVVVGRAMLEVWITD